MRKPPVEIVASLLAVTTIIISLPPYHFPPWAIFISWAGTFAAGGPSAAVLKKIWPVMPVGSFFAFLIVLCFGQASQHFQGTQFVIAQMVILFCLNTALMLTARVPGLSFIPGMFFGFASFFATFFGGFGPVPHDPGAALFAAILMNALGPAYAWMTAKFSAPHGDATHGEEHAPGRFPPETAARVPR
jgi:hypothetical protein